MRIGEIIPYEKNPRNNDDAVKYVAESIKQFGFKVPIVIDKENIIVCGHTRWKAAKKLRLEEVPCVIADDLTDEQIKAFRLADNKVAEQAEWDFDLLSAELEDLFDFDMTVFGFDEIEEEDLSEKPEKGSLADEFIIPPLSVFDTKQGYWQDRKRLWKDIGIRSEQGRDAECLQTNIGEKYGRKQMTGVSIFDPVLCEIAYKWFNVEGGKIFDCFAGGSVRGIVAAKLGYDYTGIDLRKEQVDANYENASDIGVEVKWYCDDSLNADLYIEDNSMDMIFSCPPYADLEVYSDDERDISNMEYEQFKEVYKKIIDIACRKLKNDRFAVFVVGDIRDKEGYYRNFVDYTKECFNANGLQTYNDIVLLDMLGTSMIRCKKPFNASRKLAKVHQNVLVFYKGDIGNIKNNYKEINVKDIEEGIEFY
jgi:16S rRNA G966 N2-methylase RsmD